MKKSFRTNPSLYRKGGILSQSTGRLLAGAGLVGMSMSLTSCGDSSVTTWTEGDMRMARVQEEVERVDQGAAQLSTGEVANNFFIEGLGHYHAKAQNFYEHPYQFRGPDGRYFVNGEWSDAPGPLHVAATRPSPEALEKTQQALVVAQQKEESQPVVQQQQGGFGMGNALLMYMLLSGNRGLFAPNPGFQKAADQAPRWQQGVNQQRSAVQAHAAANPNFQKMVNQRAATGQSVSSGQSVRGGMGSSSKNSASSFSSGS